MAVIFIWKPPHDGLNWSPATYKVTDVDQAGPAAEAGFQAGDVIVELGGVPIEEVYPLYEGKRAGDTATFSVLRDGRPLKIEITLERPSARAIAIRLEPLLIALCFWLLSTALLALKPTSVEMRLFFLFSQLGVMVLAAGQLSTLSVDWAFRLFNLSFCLLSPLTIHLHLVFPKFKTFPRRRLVLRLLYGLGLALSLPFVIFGPPFAANPFHLLLRVLERLYFALSIFMVMASLSHTYLSTPSERPRIRLIVLGTAFAFLPLVLFSILPEVLVGSPIFPYELSFAFLILIPLSYAYAISRYKLVQIDLILNRSVVYFVISVIWAGLYMASVMALDYLLPSAVIGRPLLGAIATLVMAAFFAPLKERTQAFVDRAFYGGWYDYRSVIG
ncbi:MAG: PDZ domain-containing protein [Anaerolineales bacterium]|nr:PDZ domain-containing protein [Anaerolineales bacterium]